MVKVQRTGKASKDAAAASQESEFTPSQVKRRQAVLIVHGIGEQRPFETLRGFVETVWGTAMAPSEKSSADDVWIVPDRRAGSNELARVTTRSQDGIATDFFELYWADLLVGNTLSQLRAWFGGLLFRWPHQVPRDLAGLWIALWLLAAAIVALLVYAGADATPSKVYEAFTKAMTQEALTERAQFWRVVATIAIGVGTMAVIWTTLVRSLRSWRNAHRKIVSVWSRKTPAELSVSFGWTSLLVLVLPVAVMALSYCFLPWSAMGNPEPWALLLAALIAFGITTFAVPVIGDVGRYVSTAPHAVSARAAIRDRGVSLLRELHGPLDPSKGRNVPYERIVIVGHSLGSIIAYDILRLFWEERGPTASNPPVGDLITAVEQMNTYCSQLLDTPDALDVEDYRKEQGKLITALRKQDGSWRVSDFVTLGSPLTHAEFLVSDDHVAFDDRKAERLFPTSPPMLETTTGSTKPSFLYRRSRDGKVEGPFTHHAAMFAATRWTNIYDPASLAVFGDFIGGPCNENFGPGVLDVKVRIVRPLARRLFTHTSYWDANVKSKADSSELAKLGLLEKASKPQMQDRPHIRLLRRALDLRRLG